ncbi:MAG: rhomboid family intramembrane serine protease [Gemmatimonadaceae bacterium]
MSSPEMDRAQRSQALRERLDSGGVNSPLLSGPVSTQSTPEVTTRTFGGTLKRGAKTFAAILGTLGAVSALNFLMSGALYQFGLIPRTSSGAWGILFHPLLHLNAAHLAVNSVGIVVIGGTVFLRSERDFWRVTALGVLVGGSATWLLGRTSLHIGASGVVFAYLGYLLTTGWFDRKLSSIAISVLAAALWGSVLFGLSPLQNGISWELHLFGFVGGVVGAWWRKRLSKP